MNTALEYLFSYFFTIEQIRSLFILPKMFYKIT